MDVSDRKQRKQSLLFNFIVIYFLFINWVFVFTKQRTDLLLSLFFVYPHTDYVHSVIFIKSSMHCFFNVCNSAILFFFESYFTLFGFLTSFVAISRIILKDTRQKKSHYGTFIGTVVSFSFLIFCIVQTLIFHNN